MKDATFKRVLVTGATGFLGRHVTARLRAELDAEIVPVGRRDADLLEPGMPDNLVRSVCPDAVVHLAARSGGIVANLEKPADYFRENLLINTNLFHAAFAFGVKRFLTFIGGCSYPALAKSPIGEDQLWQGYPQPESAPYAMAKAMVLVQSEAYYRQHGFQSVVLVPGNAYGEWDNFNLHQAHVIPALIRKFVEARDNGLPAVTVLGTGRPVRDFVYAGDVAALVPTFLTRYKGQLPVNISSGRRTSIRELAELIRRITGFKGKLAWDTSAPDGQQEKVFDVRRLHSLGFECPTPLDEGLSRTVKWYEQARLSNEVRL